MLTEPPPVLDFTDPEQQAVALTAIEAIVDQLDRATDAALSDAGAADPIAFRTAVVRAFVRMADLARWAGAVG